MPSNLDLTFITNQKNETLTDRFRVLIKSTRFFDVLVGYFFSSGFYQLYKSLEDTEKVRILIGLKTDRTAYELIKQGLEQGSLNFSHAEAKELFSDLTAEELEESEDKPEVEEGVLKFIEWIRSGKLQIRAYPTENLHAKLYVMTFAEGDRDVGRVITGSSNFSESGLKDNLEFNVELKTASDYRFALGKFNELWADAVDVSDKYVETVGTRTWLNDDISPYQLYLKFLYEYFKDKINLDQDELYQRYLPESFLDLEYQAEAVKDAVTKLEAYGGVFISDVVGLGKTYISAKLAQQLSGRHLVIAPPLLLEESNPGSWKNVFYDFKVAAKFESRGKLDKLLDQDLSGIKNVFIDEAHWFRSESTATYEKLAQICRGKRVILVTATPLNNSPKDILSQIKLFQMARNSTIPNLKDLEKFFNSLARRLKDLDRQRDHDEYMKLVRGNAQEIRDKVLKYLMVRRTRTEIETYFGEDLKQQKLRFPTVKNPEPVFYELSDEEDRIFSKTIELITKFKYARYMPMLYYKGEITQPEKLAQQNLGKFMKILLIKRLESSFYAFRHSLDRFMASYQQFISEFDKGNVYVSKKYTSKIFELLEDDNDAAIQRLIDEDKADKYASKDFQPELRDHLAKDLQTLNEIKQMWEVVHRDPKLLKFIDILSNNQLLKTSKLIVFTESKETAEYLYYNLDRKFTGQVLMFTGSSGAPTRDEVIDNFDAKVRNPKDDYRILITTEVLAEGVNLHRSNVVINYDIPWNPTRLIQRVGRINRVDTKFDEIHAYNFFPTKQSNDQIKLKEAAEAKIQAFIHMLGSDAKLLTEGEEIESFTLFSRLSSSKTITGEDDQEDSELKYLQVIRQIRDDEPQVYEQIKRLPKKARTSRTHDSSEEALITYFRKGKLHKFFRASGGENGELDFFSAAKILEALPTAKRQAIGGSFYKLLEDNKKEFAFATIEEMPEVKAKGGRDSATMILRILRSNEIKHFPKFTDEDEMYIKRVIQILEVGGLPATTTKRLVRELKEETNPLRILGKLRLNIPEKFFEPQNVSAAQTSGPREVILSEYLAPKSNG